MIATARLRSRTLLAIAVALALVAAVTIVALGELRETSAEASGPAMGLQVYADLEKTELACDFGSVGRKCEVGAGASFSVDVVATSPPPSSVDPFGNVTGGYTAYQAVLQYADGVTLKQQPGLEENRAPDCIDGAESKDEPGGGEPSRYVISCKISTENSTYAGTLANVHFNCDPGAESVQIDLVGGAGPKVSLYVDPDISGSFIFLKSQDKGDKEVADSVTINCEDPTPTPTPTATSTSTSTATSTPTDTPTATPTTPPSGSKPKMLFRVFNDKEKTELVCDKGPIGRKCTIAIGVGFSIDVMANPPPSGGYTAYQAVVQYSGDLALQPQPGLSENRAPACMSGTEFDDPGEYTISCKLSTTKTNYAGPLANIQFDCTSNGGSGQIDLIGGAGAKVSVYVNPSIYGNLIYLKSESKNGKQVADSVHINCTDDVDGDGCTDIQELGSDPMAGGLRDRTNPWDFFDTNGDEYVDVPNDILSVILAHTISGGTYNIAYDRGAPIGPYAWSRSGPDGVIDVPNDILPVIFQFNHDCR